jgi:hypothetical protein
MVPGAAQRMAGCGDAFYGSGVAGSCVPRPTSFLYRCCVHFCITYQIAPPPSAIPRNAVGL